MKALPPTLLAILAHPDDESFGIGGTLALYARRGCRTVLICATGGEAGTVDPEHLDGFASIAELRQAELRCAARQLGLRAVHFLGYRDSGMPGEPDNLHPKALVTRPLEEVAHRIVEFIRELKPDIVLTFDPAGGYRHLDHVHIHRATTLAFERAGDGGFHPEAGGPHRPRALYYNVFPHHLVRIFTRLMPLLGMDPRRWGRNRDIDLTALAGLDFPKHVRLDIRPVAAAKRRAAACHASQGGLQMSRGLMRVVTWWMSRYEDFMQAYPVVTGKPRLRHDLLDVVADDR